MMNFIISGIVAVIAMTLFSAIYNTFTKDEFREPNLLTQIFKKLFQRTLHKPLYVYGYGGLPGHPTYGDFDLCAPGRLATPKSVIPAGSVGWVGTQGGITTMDAPGGWNILGSTPMKLFNVTSADPCKIKPGQSVQFYPISLKEFDAYC